MIDPTLIESVARAMAAVALRGPVRGFGEAIGPEYLSFEIEHSWRDFAAMARAAIDEVVKRIEKPRPGFLED